MKYWGLLTDYSIEVSQYGCYNVEYKKLENAYKKLVNA